jgi:hypothetical protein
MFSMRTERHISFSSGGILLAVGLVLTLLGGLSSPRDKSGRPFLLLPDVKAVEDYRRAARDDASRLNLLGGEIAALLSGKNTDLFSQSRQAQAALEHALQIAQEIDARPAPPALDGLRGTIAQAASAYLEAARLALRWISLPQPDNKAAAAKALAQAAKVLNTLEGSQWLAK